MIAILVPTRERPEQCKRMVESVKSTSEKAHIYTALSPEERPYPIPATMILPDNLPTAHKWNLLAERALQDRENKLFMLGADDMVFETSGWDRRLIEHYEAIDNKIHVYALQDSRDAEGVPHPIMTREYIEAMNYFVPPWFLHWRIDTWTVEIAKSNGVFTHFKDLRLRHDKPSDVGKPDDTFSRIRSFGWRERDEYVHEKSQHILAVEKERLSKCLQS